MAHSAMLSCHLSQLTLADQGIFITYIEKDPEAEARAKRMERLERNKKDDEERQGEF